MIKKKEKVYLYGSCYGSFRYFVDEIYEKDINSCTIILIGKFGFNIGFLMRNEETRELEALQSLLKNRNIKLMILRSDLDTVDFFQGSFDSENIEFLPDYAIKEFNNMQFLFIGGGVSIDRKVKQEGIDYNKEQSIIYSPKNICYSDVLVTNVAPSWNECADHIVQTQFFLGDDCIEADLEKERKCVDKIINKSHTKKHFCGYFDMEHTCIIDGVESTNVGEDQLIEVTF